MLSKVFTPFGFLRMSKRDMNRLIVFWIIAAALLWQFAPAGPLFPRPAGTGRTLWWLVSERGLIVDAVESMKTILIAAGISFVTGCFLGYLYLIPFFIPPVVFIANLRNMMMNVLIAGLIMSGWGGEPMKIAAVAFLITVFFTSSLVQLMDDMDRDEYDHAVTMRMSAWQILWHRVIRFRMYFVYMAFIPCVAMGYSTLSVVEGVVRNFGGLGDLMLQLDKISSYEGIFAIAIVSGLLGFGLWLALWSGGRAYFKWATRTTVKS